MPLPVLYSFRRCPYAMRARLALSIAQQTVELREVVLKDKPAALGALSAKATVPVLQLADGQVIEESLEIMHWALNNQPIWQNLNIEQQVASLALIEINDGTFKTALDRYKYSDRYPELPQVAYRQQGEIFLQTLETRLLNDNGLVAPNLSFADLAILPFIRQWANVEPSWFAQAPYPAIKRWLNDFLASELFKNIMHNYPQWHEGDPITYFPSKLSTAK